MYINLHCLIVLLTLLSLVDLGSAWIPLLKGTKSEGLSYPYLILPGFGNDQLDYTNPFQRGEEFSLKQSLISEGVECVDVVPIQRRDWLNVAKGIFLPDFWKSQCTPDQLFNFYFDAVDAKVTKLREETGKPVVLLCHSAGGWLARAMLADGCWRRDSTNDRRSSDLVAGIVTLGAPHFPPLDEGMDMTRGALAYVNRNYPGAYLQPQGVFYITVCGTAVFGDNTAERKDPRRYAADSYVQVTGNVANGGNEAGDGIVPLSSAHLSGAQQITLPNVWHSINAPDNYWYGRADVVRQWLPQTLKAMTSKPRQRLLSKK